MWDRLRGEGFGSRLGREGEDDAWHFFEWDMTKHDAAVPDEVVLRGWTALCAELHRYHRLRGTPAVALSNFGEIVGTKTQVHLEGLARRHAARPQFEHDDAVAGFGAAVCFDFSPLVDV